MSGPVSQLVIFSKALERVVFLQLTEYLEENRLVHPNHHGGRHGHSTATAMVQMYDQWVEEVEKGKMVGLMMTDMSSAYDMVSFRILEEKLELFGLDRESLKWMKSYLRGRSQSTCVDGKTSNPLALEGGVPQGSILAPLLYILYTSDVPELIHDHPITITSPNTYCQSCGSMVSYIDDNSFSVGCDSSTELTERLTEEYKNISEYMASNDLVLNDEKTSLIVFSNKVNSENRKDVSIQAGTHIISPSVTHKLLGAHIHQSLKWNEHLLNNKESLIKQLTTRLNGLSLISKRTNLKTRLMIGNAVFNSKLCYLIQAWGGAQNYAIRALQVCQNKAMKCITGMSWYTTSRILLNKCNWLSVKQLIAYHTLLTIHKTVRKGTPEYVFKKICPENVHNTRNVVKFSSTFGAMSEKASSSFCYRGVSLYNKLSNQITQVINEDTFKRKTKKWVKENVPIQ